MPRWSHNPDLWIVALLAAVLFAHSYGPTLAAEFDELKQAITSPAEVVSPPLDAEEPHPIPVPPRTRSTAPPRAFYSHESAYSCRPTVIYVRRATGYYSCH